MKINSKMESRVLFSELVSTCCLMCLVAFFLFVTFAGGGMEAADADKCMDSTGKYDLTPLKRFVWNVSQRLGPDVVEYRIRLCSPLQSPPNCAQSSICRLSRFNEDSAISLGRAQAVPEAEEGDDDVGVWLKFRGTSCSTGGIHRVLLNLQCGTGLGSPMLVGVDDCRTFFIWKTSVACEDPKESLREEVPCYVYDSQGNRHDLTGLIRTKGGHFVPSENNPAVRFYVNVCSSLVPDAQTLDCPLGSAACRIENGETASIGRLKDAVQMTDGGKLQLVYENDVGTAIQPNCAERSRTTITFSCPSDGRSQMPVLLSETDCDYKIEWETAEGCPLKVIQSMDACHLKSDIDGIEEDISPLRVESGIPHHAEGDIDGKNYDFYVSVCGSFPSGFSCGDRNSSMTARVCRKSVDDPKGIIVGSASNQSLWYADGQMYLLYDGGEPCFPDNSSRAKAALIHLKCGSAIGNNELRFVQEKECVTFLEWETKHACVQRMVGSVCYVNDGGRVVDLSLLIKGQGEEPWLAFGERAGNKIYLNVCGPVGRSTSTIGCPAGAAVCVKGDDGKMTDFGQYLTRPEVDRDTGDIRINYTSREQCPSNSNKLMSSLITFVCHPGEMEAGPRLVSTSLDGCSMDFVWETATACTQSRINGTSCKVDIPRMGFSIDLSSLMKRDEGHYNVTVGEYDYFLNVCGGVKESLCSANGVGACQVKQGDENAFSNLGLATDVLTYYDGLVRLTYENGNNNQRVVISFLCDRETGAGYPEFLDVTRNVYNFKWKTVYVCPPRPIQCVFVNEATREQYDLSRLSRGPSMDNWVVRDGYSKLRNRKFYLNVCRSLSRTDDMVKMKCDSGASICATVLAADVETILIGNLGQAKSSPHFEDGQLTLRYNTGEPCRDVSRPGFNYSAVIYFHCANSSFPIEEESGPMFLRNISCEYTFLWGSQAACPLRTEYAGNGCSIEDPTTGYTFSFSSLNSDFIIPATGSSTYENFYVNMCGVMNASTCGTMEVASKFGPVAVCGQPRQNSESFVALATSKSRRVYIANVATVKMEFDGLLNVTAGKPNNRVEIVFLCHRDLYSPRPRFVRQDDDLFVFEYESPLTCPPQVVDCIFNDRRGNTYDLKPLTLQAHYEVRDPRTTDRNILFHLSVCRPLFVPSFSYCPEGANIGACMSDSKSGIGYSLGYVQGRPRAGLVDGATVSLSYHSGSPCKYGPDGSGQMSTRIDFKCSIHQGEPQFMDETLDCEYIFSWETPFACPLQQIIGSDCQVVDRRYSTHFNFSKLSRSDGYVVDGSNSDNSHRTFRINACGPLSTECGGRHAVGVCVDNGSGFKSSGGYFSDKLAYDQGEITLRYTGDGDTSSLIRFVCDHSTTGQVEGPTYLDAASTNISYVFIWKTSYACRSFRESSCRVYDPTDYGYYDLSRLTLLDANHEVIVDNGTYKFLINVCRSVVHVKDSMCHYGAAVCGVNLTEANNDNKYANLGEVGEIGPTFDKGVVSLKYEMGEMCRTTGSSGFHKTTKIRFSCDPSVEQGKPYLLAEDGCQYEFGWSSAVACKIKANGEESTSRSDCTAVNPKSGYKFDLYGLRQSSHRLNLSNNSNITVGVCDEVKGTSCASAVGSCLQSNSKLGISLGKANANLQYITGMLFLNYTDGAPCSLAKQSSTMSTVIRFICGQSGTGIGNPNFVEQAGCTYFVSWYTDLACETQVHCGVELDHEVMDLSPLMEFHSHHFAVGDSNDDSVYILNVCRPLTTLSGPQCPPEAAACRYDVDAGSSVSLGKVESPPFVAADGHVVIDYTNGSPCPSDAGLNASTRIIFMCDDSLMHDVVRLVDVTANCTHVFEWPTNVVCPSVTHGIVSANCSYYDTRTKGSFDLARLSDLSPSGYQIVHDEVSGGVFAVNFCRSQAPASKSTPCASAAVCLRINGMETSSWGASNTALYDYDGQHLRVSYRNGDLCTDSENSPSMRKGSVIWFACDENAGPGVPELTKSFDCQVIFYWRTSLMCRGHATSDCTLLHEGRDFYDLRLLSSYSHSWTVENSLDREEMYWLNVCGQLMGRRDPRCPPASTICWKDKDTVVAIGLSDTQKLTMSDDKQMLLLESYVAADVCDRQDFRSFASFSYSVIEFVCSSKAAKPQLVSRGDKTNNCTFTFRWETPIACPQKSLTEVLELDGKIVDENLDLTVDLSRLLKVHATVYEHRGKDVYQYIINLSGIGMRPGDCSGSAICQVKPDDDSFSRVIGRLDDMRFYLQGPELLLKLNSGSVCGRNPEKKASSLITMRCSPSAGLGVPVFVYESIDCNYVFDWETDTACPVELDHKGRFDEVSRIEAPSSNNLTIGISIVLAIALVVIVAVVVFRKRLTLDSTTSGKDADGAAIKCSLETLGSICSDIHVHMHFLLKSGISLFSLNGALHRSRRHCLTRLGIRRFVISHGTVASRLRGWMANQNRPISSARFAMFDHEVDDTDDAAVMISLLRFDGQLPETDQNDSDDKMLDL